MKIMESFAIAKEEKLPKVMYVVFGAGIAGGMGIVKLTATLINHVALKVFGGI